MINSLKRIVSVVALTVGMFVVIAGASSADYYLKIGDIKGESARVLHCTNGVCSVEGIASGSLAAVVCDAQGIPVSSGEYRLRLTFKPSALRESPTKASLGKTSRAGATDSTVDVVAPRDAASGMPTGKRTHKPMVITKEWGRTSRAPVQASTPAGDEYSDVSRWTLEVRVDRIEIN
jgi:hypothetical protein